MVRLAGRMGVGGDCALPYMLFHRRSLKGPLHCWAALPGDAAWPLQWPCCIPTQATPKQALLMPTLSRQMSGSSRLAAGLRQMRNAVTQRGNIAMLA